MRLVNENKDRGGEMRVALTAKRLPKAFRRQIAGHDVDPGTRSQQLFQVAYDEKLLFDRGRILRRSGYEVTSVLGNEAAKAVLVQWQQIDLFVIGHNAPEQVRLEMVYWLRAHYPGVRILALNPPGVERLEDLRYNATYNAPPDTWLPLVAAGATQTDPSP